MKKNNIQRTCTSVTGYSCVQATKGSKALISGLLLIAFCSSPTLERSPAP